MIYCIGWCMSRQLVMTVNNVQYWTCPHACYLLYQIYTHALHTYSVLFVIAIPCLLLGCHVTFNMESVNVHTSFGNLFKSDWFWSGFTSFIVLQINFQINKPGWTTNFKQTTIIWDSTGHFVKAEGTNKMRVMILLTGATRKYRNTQDGVNYFRILVMT